MQTYLINHRALSYLHPLQQELRFTDNENYLFDLSYLAALDVEGAGAADFLQGQLTCDVREVNAHQMRCGAMCQLQGRILALLDVLQWQGLHLILPADLLDATQAALAKAAMFSRVTLVPNTSLTFLGFYLQNPKGIIPNDALLPNTLLGVCSEEQYSCYRISDKLYLFVLHNKSLADTFRDQFPVDNQRGSLAWHRLRLASRLIEIYPNSRELFLPHRLGLQETTCLSFNKGCYKGQEIIARTHYRAKLKHHMQLAMIESIDTLYSGQKMFDPTTGAEIGELVDYAPINETQAMVAASTVFEHANPVRFEHQPDDCLSFLQPIPEPL